MSRGRKLRIAQVAPLFIRVPPARYGGTERVISVLTEELVRRGHDVTLFAAGTSTTSARLRCGSPLPLWDIASHHRLAYQVAQVEDVMDSAKRFDVIHWHTDYMHLLVDGAARQRFLTTLHGRLDGDCIRQLLGRHSGEALVSISDAQRRPVSDLDLNWVATVHHGLDLAHTYRLGPGDGGYLAFVGRSTPDKDLATAIRVAIRSGLPIKIAARIDPNNLPYHESEVEPLLSHPLVDWLGETTEGETADLLEHALAFLVPLGWEEPFGLSFIEALAAGTPVVARPMGALPELMRNGRHGFFGETESELAAACQRVASINRVACRRWALERFSAERMAEDYERAYDAVLSGTAKANAS